MTFEEFEKHVIQIIAETFEIPVELLTIDTSEKSLQDYYNIHQNQ